MYKTVRHGENSLQYTILPQTEEVLNNSGVKGKGRDYSPSIHIRRSRRDLTAKYVLLVIFSIVAMLGLFSIPFFVMHSLITPIDFKEPELVTAAPPAGLLKPRKKELKVYRDIIVTPQMKVSSTTTPGTTTSSPSTTVTTPVTSDKATTPPWTMPALRSWKSSSTIQTIPTEDTEKIPLIGTPSGSIRLLDHYSKHWEDIIIKPTVAPEAITLKNIFKHYTRYIPTDKSVTAKFDDVLIRTKGTTVRTPITTELTTSEGSKLKDLKDTLLSVDDDDEFKESLEVDEVFSLPSLKPDYAAPGMESDEVTVSKAGDGWYAARWPFVDTSSYFQWTGYSPGDNLLLPLLVAALSSIALVLLLALAVRKRKRTHMASAQIGKLTADLQADDNTNLLTAENPEEGEVEGEE